MTELSVSILGSFRKHYLLVVAAAREFEAHNIKVNSPAISRIVNPGELFVRFENDVPHSSDHIIQNNTFRHIFASDFIYVMAPGGYIGRTTCYEVGRVQERDIPIFFSEQVRDLPIEICPDSVLSPSDLARRMMARRQRRL